MGIDVRIDACYPNMSYINKSMFSNMGLVLFPNMQIYPIRPDVGNDENPSFLELPRRRGRSLRCAVFLVSLRGAKRRKVFMAESSLRIDLLVLMDSKSEIPVIFVARSGVTTHQIHLDLFEHSMNP